MLKTETYVWRESLKTHENTRRDRPISCAVFGVLLQVWALMDEGLACSGQPLFLEVSCRREDRQTLASCHSKAALFSLHNGCYLMLRAAVAYSPHPKQAERRQMGAT